jgi:hypothetical protein
MGDSPWDGWEASRFSPHVFLECLAQSNELTTLDEEMGCLSPTILVEVGVLVTSPVEDFVHQGRWLVVASAPFCLWPGVTAGVSTVASIVCVAPARAVMVVVVFVVGVACCH